MNELMTRLFIKQPLALPGSAKDPEASFSELNNQDKHVFIFVLVQAINVRTYLVVLG